MNLKKLSDNDLLNVYLSGNENAVTVLVNRHRRRVFDYINMMVKDRDLADDIFQETLIKVIRFVNDGRYTENGKFLSWVLRIAHNQVIDHFRQKKQQNHISEGEAGYDLLNNRKLSDSTVEDRMISDPIAEDVRKLVDFLLHIWAIVELVLAVRGSRKLKELPPTEEPRNVCTGPEF